MSWFIFLNFDSIDSKLIEFANVILELKHRYNNFRSLKSLIEFLESYLKLLIKNRETILQS